MTDNIVAIIVFGIVIILTFVLPYAFHVQEKTYAKHINRENEAKLKKAEKNIDSLQKEKEVLSDKNKELERKITERDCIISDIEKEKADLLAAKERLSDLLKKEKEEREADLPLQRESESIYSAPHDASPDFDAVEVVKLQSENESLQLEISSWKENYKRQTQKLLRIKRARPDINILDEDIYEYTEEEIDAWYKAFVKDVRKRKKHFLSTKISANPILGDVNELLSIHCDPKAIFKSIYNGAWNRVRETFLRVKVLHVDAVIDSGDKIYATTLDKCDCEDFLRKNRPCKHMIYLAYVIGYLQLNKDLIEETENDSIRRLSNHHKKYYDEKKELEKERKKLEKLQEKINKERSPT